MQIGEESLGDFAREQLEKARRDPRLDRGRGAMVADFWAAMEEVERTRMLGILGLYELRRSWGREEERSTTRPRAHEGQARWERAELANAEILNGHPGFNAQALIGMNSALDALVEDFVSALLEMPLQLSVKRAEKEVPEAVSQLTPELRDKLLMATRKVFKLSKPKTLRGSGTKRYEPLLEQVGLGAPDDRPVPGDLDQALRELGALRDVLVHRAGRVDSRAKRQAPSLAYEDGELVRFSDDGYRTYSAAVRCYANEIIYRSIRHWPEVSDDNDGPNLANWRDYRLAGV